MEDTKQSDGGVEYDEIDGAYRVSVAAVPADSVSMVVVSFVAALEDVPTAELDPLYDSVDPEALDSLHESLVSGGADGHVAFPYEGYEITVGADAVSARPLEE